MEQNGYPDTFGNSVRCGQGCAQSNAEQRESLLLFGLIQFCACALQERYTGNPWYLFVLFMPLMIYGGGMEEVGWQGIVP